MKILRFIALFLIIVGALNWGLIGFFQYNLVGDLLGGMTSKLARIVFALVGLSGLWGIGLLCRCGSGKCGPGCGCSCCSDKSSCQR